MALKTFSKEVMNDGASRIQAYIKKNKTLPNYCEMKSREEPKKVIQLPPKQYAGLFENQNIFLIKHGRQPNYTTLNVTANNPLVMNYQDNGYNCCPASLSMISMLMYRYKSENEFKVACKTNTNGTTPTNMIGGAKKLGFKVSSIGRNSSSVKKALDFGSNKHGVCTGVIAHIETKPASCLGYLNNYGHWIVIYKVGDKYYIADPTKGIKSCNFSVLDKATNGRDIKYYKVELV